MALLDFMGPIGQAVNAIGGGISGGIMQRKTNQMNMKINQMNNEFNERMLDKQLAFQEDMWNKTNEYNSASSQRQRLEAAGLNPYLMMSGGNAGTASAMSGGSASAAPPIAMQNAGAAGVGAASALGQLAVAGVAAFAGAKKDLAEATGQQINNDFLYQRNMAELSQIFADTKNKEALADMNRLRYQFDLQNFDTALEAGKIQNTLNREMVRNVQAQTLLSRLQSDAQYIKNQFLPQDMQLGLMQKVADLNQTHQLTKESVAREVKAYAEAAKIKVDTRIIEAIADSIIEATNSQNWSIVDYNNAYSGWSRGWNQKRIAEASYDLAQNQINYNNAMVEQGLGYLNLAQDQFKLTKKQAKWSNALGVLGILSGAGARLGSAAILGGKYR